MGQLKICCYLLKIQEFNLVLCSSYIKCLENGNDVPVGGKGGLLSLKIGLAAIKSIKERRPLGKITIQ